jgi:hypothetical protein
MASGALKISASQAQQVGHWNKHQEKNIQQRFIRFSEKQSNKLYVNKKHLN